MAERLQQIEQLFHAALALQPKERASFLSEACSSDPHLMAEVEALISAHERSGSFLDTPAYAPGQLPADSQTESPVGRTLGHYEVLSVLGRGGMGSVYLARDTRLERKVALKLLPPQFTADEVRLRRFVQEAKATSSLNHPNIITIHEIGQTESLHFIAMEFIEGKTLRQHIASQPMPAAEALNVTLQVASALSAAHAAGIVHRDIKPENIMLRPDGYVKVLDFGLAKLTERQVRTSDPEATTAVEIDTDPGTIMGTITYMSPEQVRGQAVDARSDIFSLGVTLYEMIAGQPPFEGGTNADVLAAILKSKPPPISHFTPDAPAPVQRIVNRALIKDREQRYQSSDEMLAELSAVKEEIELAVKLGRSLSSTPGLSALLPLRLFSSRVALILLLTVVVAAGLWWSYAGLVAQTPDSRSTNRLSSLKSDQLHSWKSERGEGEIRARFSSNGRSFAYSSLSGGWLRIWVKEAIAGTEPYLVTSDETDNRMPIWSPDDQQIAFVSTRENQTGIWSVPASGGEAVLLKALNDSNPQPIHWSKDGSTIYYQSAFNLYALDIASKETSQITDLKRSRLPRSFSISPGEGQIAYSDDKDGQVDLWFASLRGGDPVQLTRDPEEDRYPIWHPDGERILYTSNRGGVSEICVAYLDGRPPLQLTTGASGERRVSDISRDGTRMIEVTTRDDAEVYGVEVDTGREFDVPHEIGLNLWPDVSPDGKMIAFQYTSPVGRLVSSSVIARPLAGQGRVQLAFNGFNLRWSPDGSALAFLRVSGGTTDIFTVNAAGGDEKQLTSGGIYIGGYAILPCNRLVRDYCWSPDGTKIVYSTARSGYSNLWTINRDGSEDLQITSNSDANLVLYDPLYSPDGGRIAYISETRTKLEDGKKVWSLQLAEQGESRTVFQANSLIRLVGWSESGNELIVAVDKDNSGYRQFPIDVSVLVIDAGGSNREIGTFKSTYIVTTQLSPDGQTLSFVSDQDGADNIWAVPVTGGRARKITANADPKLYLANPVWSPDGKMIYYSKQTRWNVISAVQNFN